MKNCDKCNKRIPKSIWIGDKKKYTSIQRKFCFDCSPFGQHNTKNLNKKHNIDENGKIIYEERICPKCNKKHTKRGIVCQVCATNEKQRRRVKAVIDIAGNECKICGYNKNFSSVSFHHVIPEDKCFSLSSREISNYSWDKVTKEMRKCVMVCLNCHGEIHAGLIKEDKIKKLWEVAKFNLDSALRNNA